MNKFFLSILLINSVAICAKDIKPKLNKPQKESFFSQNDAVAKAIANYDTEAVILSLSENTITANKKQQILNYISAELIKRKNGLSRTNSDILSIIKGVMQVPVGLLLGYAGYDMGKKQATEGSILGLTGAYALISGVINLKDGITKQDAKDKFKKIQAIDLFVRNLPVNKFVVL